MLALAAIVRMIRNTINAEWNETATEPAASTSDTQADSILHLRVGLLDVGRAALVAHGAKNDLRVAVLLQILEISQVLLSLCQFMRHHDHWLHGHLHHAGHGRLHLPSHGWIALHRLHAHACIGHAIDRVGGILIVFTVHHFDRNSIALLLIINFSSGGERA